MTKKPRFKNFVDELPASNSVAALPLTHGTTAHSLRDIMSSGEIKLKKCEFLGKDLLFTFYGRPAYKPNNSKETIHREIGLPVFFIISKDLLADVELAYPFDTGALKAGFYADHLGVQENDADLQQVLSDYQFSPSSDRVSSLVTHYYASNENYLSNAPLSNPKFSGDEFEAKTYHGLIASMATQGDERASTFEIIFAQALQITDPKFLAIVLPDILAESGKTADLIRKTNMTILPYRTRRGLSWDHYISDIYNIVERYFDEKNLS